MPSALELAIVLTAIDRASAPVRAFQKTLEGVGSTARDVGQRMRDWGEQTAIAGALVTDVGEKMSGALESVIEPALASQDAVAKLSAAVHLTAEETEMLEKASVAYSNSHVGSEEVFKATSQTFLQQKDALGGVENALKATRIAVSLAAATDGDAIETGQLLTQIWTTMGDSTKPAAAQIQSFADVIAKTREVFPIDDVNEFKQGLAALGPVAGSLHVPFAETAGLLAQVQTAVGARGVRSFTEGINQVLGDSKKIQEAGINPNTDFIGILEQVRSRFDALGSQRGTEFVEKTFGGASRGILSVLPHLDELEGKIGEVGNAGGALNKALSIRESSALEQWKVFQQTLHNVAVTIGATVLPALNGVTQHLKPIAEAVEAFAKANSQLVKWVLIIGAALTGVTLLAGAVVAFLGTLGIVGGAILTGIGFVTAAVGAVAAFAASWGLVISAVVAVGAFIWAFGPKILAAGENIVKMLGQGILAGAHWAIDAIEGVVKKLRAYLPFSPAKTGPFRDLHRVKIVETIAQSIRPDSAVKAMRRAAAAIALSGAVIMPSAASAGSAAAPATINITINVAGDVTERNMSALVDRIKHELENRDRTSF